MRSGGWCDAEGCALVKVACLNAVQMAPLPLPPPPCCTSPSAAPLGCAPRGQAPNLLPPNSPYKHSANNIPSPPPLDKLPPSGMSIRVQSAVKTKASKQLRTCWLPGR